MSTKKTAALTGRPPVLADSDVVYIDGRAANTILQSASDRRALVNRIVDIGGRATVKELNDLFGYDTRQLLLALSKQGWIGCTTKKSAALPRRTKAMMAQGAAR